MDLGIRAVKIENEEIRHYFGGISQAQKELEREGYYVRVGDRLIDPNGDIYTDDHPVMVRARQILDCKGKKIGQNSSSFLNPIGEILIEGHELQKNQ